MSVVATTVRGSFERTMYEASVSSFVSQLLGEPLTAIYLKEISREVSDLSWTFLRVANGQEIAFRISVPDTDQGFFLPGMQDVMLANFLCSSSKKRSTECHPCIIDGFTQGSSCVSLEFSIFSQDPWIGRGITFQICAISLEILMESFALLGLPDANSKVIPELLPMQILRVVAKISGLSHLETVSDSIRSCLSDVKIELYDCSKRVMEGEIQRENGKMIVACRESIMNDENQKDCEAEKISLSIELGDIELPIESARTLRAGDILRFDTPDAISTVIRLGGKRWAKARFECDSSECRLSISSILSHSEKSALS